MTANKPVRSKKSVAPSSATPDEPVGKLSDAYRSARRALAGVCGLAIAWSTAQFDVTVLKLDPVGEVSLRAASIPLLLFTAVVYLSLRACIEFAMQEERVRRWRLAQKDFLMVANVVRVAVVLLAAAVTERSFWSAPYWVAFAVVFAVGYLLAGSAIWLLRRALFRPVAHWLANRTGTSRELADLCANASAVLVVAVLLLSLVVLQIFPTPGHWAWGARGFPPPPWLTIGLGVVVWSFQFEDVLRKSLFLETPKLRWRITGRFFDQKGIKH